MYYPGFFSSKWISEPFLCSLFSAVCMMRGHESDSEPVMSRSSWRKGMLNTTWTESYVPRYFILSYRYFWWSSYNVATEFSLCYQSRNWHRWSALSNATLRWKCRFKTEHSSTLCREETARKQNATQTGRVFLTEVIPRSKCCRGRTNAVLGFT